MGKVMIVKNADYSSVAVSKVKFDSESEQPVNKNIALEIGGINIETGAPEVKPTRIRSAEYIPYDGSVYERQDTTNGLLNNNITIIYYKNGSLLGFEFFDDTDVTNIRSSNSSYAASATHIRIIIFPTNPEYAFTQSDLVKVILKKK